MAKSITLNITQKIIDDAMEKDSGHCMIAQALRRRGAHSTRVTAEAATFNMSDGMRYTYPLPPKAVAKLIAFDQNKASVEPFSFILLGQQAYSRPVEIRGPAQPKAKAKVKTKPGKRRAKPAATRSIRRFHGLRVIEVEKA